MIARDFASLTTSTVSERIGEETIVLLPVGAIEQHGPHLPLSTDFTTAHELAKAVAEQYGEELDLWIMPPLAYSKSNEHETLPGTITLQTETLLRVLDDIGASLARSSVRRFAILNGHGGNSSLLDVVCRDLRVKHRLSTFLLHTLLPPDQGGPVAEGELGLGFHAGRDETSLMLHLEPDTVDMSKAERTLPEWLASYRHISISGPVRFGWMSTDVSPNGVTGDPTLASGDEGAALFSLMVEGLRAQLQEVSNFEFGRVLTGSALSSVDS